MSVLIIDTCSYTIEGIRSCFNQGRRGEKVIANISSTTEFSRLFRHAGPRLVIINDSFFTDSNFCLNELKSITLNNRLVLFVIFVASLNIRYQELVLLDDNVVVCSKEINKLTLKTLLSPGFFSSPIANEICRFTLSPAEKLLINFWMSGAGTDRISKSLNISSKTVSTHKGNIKRKLRTHNMQVIYNIVKLAEVLLPDVFIRKSSNGYVESLSI